jgi:hypothetical protein
MPEQGNIQFVSTIIYIILIFLSAIITVLGSMIIMIIFTRRRIQVKEEIIKNRNIGMALIFSSFIWTIGNMCYEATSPIMNVWYSKIASGFTIKTTLLFIGGMLGSLLAALLTGGVIVYLSIKLLMIINRGTREWEEVKRSNIAVAVVISTTVVVVGMFFKSIISFIVISIFE